MVDGDIDWERLDETVRTAVTFLDRVVDINFYPTEQAGRSNAKVAARRPRAMGLQDVFFKLRVPFDSPQAKALSTRIAERIMLAAYEASADLAERSGPLPAWEKTRTARGVLHPDHYGVELDLAGALGGTAGTYRRGRHAHPPPRHRPHRHHRVHRGRVRVHRAPGVRPVQARDALR